MLVQIADISEDGVIVNSTTKVVKPKRQQIDFCKEWIELHCVPYQSEKAWNMTVGSYSFKGAVERWLNKKLNAEKRLDVSDYVTNGAFIVAALELGYRARARENSRLPDAYFNMGLKFRKGSAEWFQAGFIHR